MSKVSHSVSSNCATSSFHLKISIAVDSFGLSISHFPPAAAWDDGSVFQIKRATAPVNALLVRRGHSWLLILPSVKSRKGSL